MQLESTGTSIETKKTSRLSVRFLLLILTGFAVAFALANAAYRTRAGATPFREIAAIGLELAAVIAIFFSTLFLLLKLCGKIFDRFVISQAAMWFAVIIMSLALWLSWQFYSRFNFSISPVSVAAMEFFWPHIMGIQAMFIGLAVFRARHAAANSVKRNAAVFYLSLAVAYLFALALPLVTIVNLW